MSSTEYIIEKVRKNKNKVNKTARGRHGADSDTLCQNSTETDRNKVLMKDEHICGLRMFLFSVVYLQKQALFLWQGDDRLSIVIRSTVAKRRTRNSLIC